VEEGKSGGRGEIQSPEREMKEKGNGKETTMKTRNLLATANR